MNNKPIILVTGVTGEKGGTVARALLADGNFSVRILAQNEFSRRVVSLKHSGATVAEGALSDPTSLQAALSGCYGVFGVTDYSELPGKEYEEGKNLLDAVKSAGINHLVLHTFPDYGQLSGGKYPVPHCDTKAALQAYAKALELPASFVQPAFHYENFFNLFPLQEQSDGSLTFGFPQGATPMPMVSIEDLGPVVASIFNHPSAYVGRTVRVVGANKTCEEYAVEMSSVLGRNVRYVYIPHNEYAMLGFPGAVELANMFEVQRTCIPDRSIDLIESYGLHPNLRSFPAWLKENKYRFAQNLGLIDEAIAA